MLCPDDDHALEEIQDWDYPYYKCPHCDGVWIDSTIKDQFFITKTDLNLPDLNSINPNKLLPNEDFKCPKDGGNLFVYAHSGTEIDICEKCGGIWLDYGEKEEIEKENQTHDKSPFLYFGLLLLSALLFLFGGSEELSALGSIIQTIIQIFL